MKDLVDFETVESFLSYLEQKRIAVSTFEEVYDKCVNVPGFRVQGSRLESDED